MAKEFYGYFDSTESDPRSYLSDEFAEGLRTLGGTGVSRGLAVAPAGGLRAGLSPGAAMIHGYVYALTDDGGTARDFVLSSSGSADRIDRIILRLDLSAGGRMIVPTVLEGVPGPQPTAPELTNTELIKEISLCQVLVRAAAGEITAEDITDERLDETVCGALLTEQISAALATKMSAESGEELAQAIAAKASTARYDAVLMADGWSGEAPFQQTVEVEGILLTDDPFVDVNMSGAKTGEEGTALSETWMFVGRVEASQGSITAYCYENMPEMDIPLILKVVR